MSYAIGSWTAVSLSPEPFLLSVTPTMSLSNGVKIAPVHITATHAIGGGHSSLKSRGRSNSIVKVEEIGETQEQMLDQSVYANMNVEWVNRKGE